MMSMVKPAELVLDDAYQPRVTIDLDLVQDYAETMLSGWGSFPPIEAFKLGGRLHVVDGFHRVKAAIRAKVAKVPVNIRQGTADDALLFCVRANSTHGLRRTNEDKRRAVVMLLKHPIYGQHGKGKIAELAGVSKPMVIDIVRQLQGEPTSVERRKSRVGSGVESTPNTTDADRRGVESTLPPKLPQSIRNMVESMRHAGASAEIVRAAVDHALANRQPRQPSPKRSTEERLRSLLEKVAKDMNKVAVVTLTDATPRTKTFAKLPRILKGGFDM
jgi:hypothetical protein